MVDFVETNFFSIVQESPWALGNAEFWAQVPVGKACRAKDPGRLCTVLCLEIFETHQINGGWPL